MTDSPYAPPKAAIAKGEPPEPGIPRPPAVTRAVTYLWLSFGISLVAQIGDVLMPASDELSWELAALINLIFAAIFVWVTLALAKGRDWARIFTLALTALAVLFTPVILYFVEDAQTRFDAVVYVICTAMDCYACYLLFTGPAKEWYRAMKG